MFWRNPSAAFFNFLLPLLLLVLIASAFAGDDDELEVLVPGVAGMGVLATTFTALAFNLTFLREEGVLKRIRGTPMPAGAYLAGLIGSAALNAARAGGARGADRQPRLRRRAGRTTRCCWRCSPCSGVVCFASLGIAFSHVIPNEDAAPAYTNAVFLPLLFISGVFYSADELPEALKTIAEVLPLKHLIDGLSEAIVGGGGDAAAAAAVVGAWAIARCRAGRALLPLGVGRGATAAGRARGGAATPRARASPGSGRRAGARSAASGPAPRGGPPRAPRRSRGSPPGRAAGAS